MFKHVKDGKLNKSVRQKLSKHMLIAKFHSRIKCWHISFSFFPLRMRFHPGMKRDEIYGVNTLYTE